MPRVTHYHIARLNSELTVGRRRSRPPPRATNDLWTDLPSLSLSLYVRLSLPPAAITATPRENPNVILICFSPPGTYYKHPNYFAPTRAKQKTAQHNARV